MVNNPWLPAIFPVLAFAGYLVGGERVLALSALGLPLLWLLMIALPQRRPFVPGADPVTGFGRGMHFDKWCNDALRMCDATGKSTACFMFEIDEADVLNERFGPGGADRVLQALAHRLRDATRGADRFARLDDWRFGLVLDPVPQMNLESAIQLAARLQAKIEEPVKLGDANIYVSASFGLSLMRDLSEPDAGMFIHTAEVALKYAKRNGPAAIRAYSVGMEAAPRRADNTILDVASALDAGDIKPWFQPQIDCETHALTGCEALARWEHPDRGLIPPAEFLPLIEQDGCLERLGEDMLFHALSMLHDLDARGCYIPSIGVNFSQTDLQNPKLPDRIVWELDRHGISANRLCIEILEQVVAEAPDALTVRNISALAEAGCRIDLDDFGTGHASITSLRRFAVDRLKIDRSFVVNCDQDPDQRRMVSTILSMASQLGLDTLAEGVETIGEQIVLTELGCGHLQGFGIARPMPVSQLPDWIEAHASRLAQSEAEASAPAALIFGRE